MAKEGCRLNIIVDEEGVEKVQIIGTAEEHTKGHEFYMRIRDLILRLNKEIQERVVNDNKNLNG